MNWTLICHIFTIFLAFNIILFPSTTYGLPNEEHQESDIFDEQVLLNK